MSPADIASAELRAGFARRLTELGLLPPDPAVFRLPASPVPSAPAGGEDRAAA
jgi:hypothetical protein